LTAFLESRRRNLTKGIESHVNVRIQAIGHIAVSVEVLDRAVRFYRDGLELPLLFQINGLAFFDVNGIRLMLTKPEGGLGHSPSSIFYFVVDDLEKTYSTLKQRNVDFLDSPHLIAKMNGMETWMAFFHDSEGNTLALMSEHPYM
jgi:predicted enzyme related to lactoylglutathione lyase